MDRLADEKSGLMVGIGAEEVTSPPGSKRARELESKKKLMRLQTRISTRWNEQYIDAPFRLGGMTKEEGYDCVSMIYTMLCRLGADIRPYWGQTLDITNYWQPYRPWLIPGWIRSLGESVPVSFRRPGDILLCYFRNVGHWGGVIYLGNEICGIVNGEINRVGCCPFKMIKPWVIEVRRCLP